MATPRPYAVDDHDDNGPTDLPFIDLTDEESAEDEVVEVLAIQARDHDAQPPPTRTGSKDGSNLEVRFCRLEDGTVIKAGDFVELKLPQHRDNCTRQSGDFILVKKIISDARTKEVRLRGHRMLRAKYCTRIFPETLNELILHYDIEKYDDRPASVQGLEDVPLTEVIKKRDVTLTSKPYPMLSFRDRPPPRYPIGMSEEDRKDDMFHRGPLVCRKVWISIRYPNGKSKGTSKVYATIIRDVSASESVGAQGTKMSLQPNAASMSRPATSVRRFAAGDAPVGSRKRSASRTPSIEELDSFVKKPHPVKNYQYTFLDICCGAGGASRGADDAGLFVAGGVDMDRTAMMAWQANFPGGIALAVNMHKITKIHKDIFGRVDIVWLSIPCQPYSPNHTKTGKNDAKNIQCIEAVRPIMELFKPRIVVLENTSGLANMNKNMVHFHRLLRHMLSACNSGYNVCWEVSNLMDVGVPQKRKRLFIKAVRKGIPIPPFPKPDHGPPGSGLQPYKTMGDALAPLERLAHRHLKNPHHRPKTMKRINKAPYDPYTKVINCIQTKGEMTPHPSGTRLFTPWELGAFQTLPPHHVLAGSRTDALRQVGNMVPSLAAKKILLLDAQVLEAFDHGLIDAQDEIDDLDVTLVEKGVEIPASTHTIDLTGSSAPASSPYRYLTTPILSDTKAPRFTSAFARRVLSSRQGPEKGVRRALRGMSLGGAGRASGSESASPSPRKKVDCGERERVHIVISSGSEDEGDE